MIKILTAATALALWGLALAGPARALDNVVTVTGEAEIAVVPDAVRIHAGVVTQGKTAREATDANSKQMNALLAALRKDGVAERDIQTSRLSINPMRAPGRGMDAPITGFQTTNQVTVLVRDTTKLPALLDKVIDAGANNINGIDFVVTEPGKALDKVRTAAVEDARRKAEIYATAGGGKLGRALAINEGIGGPRPYPKAAMAVREMAVPIAAGEETLRVSVTVTFALIP
ncbi:MAG: SIMPL domain-containing protein [Pseudolabrys sp.]